jgi:hypothetical protein
MRNPFSDELRRLDLLLHRELLRLRAGYQLSLDELRGIYISDEQVDALIARAHPPGAPTNIEELTRAAEELRLRIGDSSPLASVAQRLELEPFERDALLVALAPELHLKYEALYGYLNNAAARRHATVDLMVRLCARAPGDRAYVHASARLLRDGLLETVDPPSERRPELARELVVAPALAAALTGASPFDPRLAAFVEPAADRPAAHVPLPSTVQQALEQLTSPLRSLADKPVVVLVAERAQAPEAVALQILRALGRGLLRFFGSASPLEPWLSPALALLARLRDDGVFIDVEEWTAEARRALPGLLAALSRARVPVVLTVAPTSEWRSLMREQPAVTLHLDAPTVSERRLLWSRALASHPLGAASGALSDVAEHFRLGPSQIAGAAHSIALGACEGEDERQRLFSAAREQSSGDLGHLALVVPPRHAWSDLVLPPVVTRRLREVTGAIASRAKVFGDWGFGRRSGSGLMVLFAGSSGTGKTMSASVIAREIGLELYRIELASVVSKYIGETEKNLHRIFEAARSANVILFFDEADALLGRRSEVKDAHDRYANIEVAYLLQKMEEHDGVVILASNLSKNMDQAFARRIHYVVEFPRPDAPLRERLWRRILPPEVPVSGDLDFDFLARQFDLAGGDIKTIALDAAFLAAGENRALTMADLVGAVSRQMFKQGRPVGASDFKQYHRHVPDGVPDDPAAR